MTTIEILPHSSLKFNLGQLVATPGVIASIDPQAMAYALLRHGQGDWGDLGEEDKTTNDEALVQGDRLLSSYHDGETKFWVITEWDRSVTTVLLPSEY